VKKLLITKAISAAIVHFLTSPKTTIWGGVVGTIIYMLGSPELGLLLGGAVATQTDRE